MTPNATVTTDGNDQAGTITVTTSSNPTVGELAKVIFNKPYGIAPKVILTPANDNAADIRYFVNSTTADFNLTSRTTPEAGKTYSFNYLVIQ